MIKRPLLVIPEVRQKHQGGPGQRQVSDWLLLLLGESDQRQHQLRHRRLLTAQHSGGGGNTWK